MSGVFGNPWLYNSDDSFYPYAIDQSLRFNNEDSAKLYFDPTQDGDKQKWTWSGWVKRGNLGLDYSVIFSGMNSSGHQTDIRFEGEDTIRLITASTALSMNVITTRVFRDTSSWYHIVVAIDTTQSTLTDRFKVYVNGVQETSFSATTCTQNHNCIINTASNVTHNIGANGYNTSVSSEFDGYLAEINFIDGTQLTPASFGETSEGVWIPKEYTGSYGTNGFYLTFQGTGTATTSQGTTAQTNIGDDQSGTGNNFTVINSVAEDVMPDSPTNNFATFNPLDISGTTLTYSEGNLKAERTSSSFAQAYSSFSFDSGKWYAEFLLDTGNSGLGVIAGTTNPSSNRYMGQDSYTYGYYSDGRKVNNASYTSYGDSYTTAADGSGDVVGVYIDADNGNIYFSKNGTVQNSGTAAFTGVTGPFRFAIASESNCFHIANFGQDDSFAGLKTSGSAAASDENGNGVFYDAIALSGYLAPCTASITTASISPSGDSLAEDHFNVVLYTGESDDDVTATNTFAADWVWLKCRNNTDNPYMQDAVRGFGASKSLSSSTTGSEGYNGGAPSTMDIAVTDTSIQFLGDDFTKDGRPFVAWTWKAGGATPTKTYKVVVDNDGANKYRFRNSANDATFATYAPTIELQEGGTYVFDWSDDGTNGAVSAQSHPIRFSTTSDGTHGGGSEYTTGVVKDDSAYTTTITVAAGAPTLYYYCQYHSGMGGQVNTNSTFGSTNFDGTLLSVATVNESAGFSILKYTGNLSGSGTASVGHGLSAKPEMVISKSQNVSGADGGNWSVWFNYLTNNNHILRFESAAGESNKAGNGDMASLFTAKTFGTNYTTGLNVTGNNYIAYCFHSVDQYCKVGSFEGTSSADGTFVFCNFRPKFIIIKGIDQSSDWAFYDDQREGYNVDNDILRANAGAVEQTDNDIDILSNGFKCRRNSPTFNQSTLVFIAWASQPFKFSNAR